MTRPDTTQCIHEPFGDAFYFGPEKISPAFADDPDKCLQSGHSETTYASMVSVIEDTIRTDPRRRVFIKDMAYHIVPCYPDLKPATASPSLASFRTDDADTNNPSLLPWSILKNFQITFLIRNPELSVPSKYKFTVPPLQQTTGMKQFYPREIGYREIRLVVDYLRERQEAGRSETDEEIVVIDADDLLANPSAIVQAYCEKVGIQFDEDMLRWDRNGDRATADRLLKKYRPYHLDALESSGFVSRSEIPASEGKNGRDEEWIQRFGEKGAALLRRVVDGAMEDYRYLRQFRLRDMSVHDNTCDTHLAPLRAEK